MTISAPSAARPAVHLHTDSFYTSILGPWSLPPFRAACRRAGITLSSIVLRPSLDVALARAAAREGRHLTEVEPIVGLYGAFADLGPLEVHVVDSSDLTVEQTAADLRTGLGTARFVLAAE